MQDINVFKRYEIKYILTSAERAKLIREMDGIMKIDKYGKTTIRNLYFDTDNYRVIRTSCDKPVYKEKLRVRSYQRVGGDDDVFVELKKKFDKFLYDHESVIQVREGYGTTETVTACCLTPPNKFKEGSIGLPFPDTYIKIVKPDTDIELPYGEEGEILLAGPTVMKGYMNHPDETAHTLRTHADGLTWVYTGDLGMMDEEGFVYFRGRAKRMIISSGYNVYPAQLENILDSHEKVQMSCVIGVPDPYRMQKVKAFVTLKKGVEPTDETRQEILSYCRVHIAKYAMPYDIEFRDEMPKTLVGKVNFRLLEEEELKKMEEAKKALEESEQNASAEGK